MRYPHPLIFEVITRRHANSGVRRLAAGLAAWSPLADGLPDDATDVVGRVEVADRSGDLQRSVTVLASADDRLTQPLRRLFGGAGSLSELGLHRFVHLPRISRSGLHNRIVNPLTCSETDILNRVQESCYEVSGVMTIATSGVTHSDKELRS